jgi:hypothetical protein
MAEYWRLIGEIAQCPIVTAIRSGAYDSTHPCHTIVRSQRGSLFQIPEPWSGRLDVAPILFISSNPSIDDFEKYPDQSWNPDQAKSFFHDRFSANAPWVRDGLYTLQRDSSYSLKWVRFWASARSRTSEILGKNKCEIKPGLDFALTEVVHCKSRGEEGVGEAREFCSERYLSRTLSASAAKVLVVFGESAKKAFAVNLGAAMTPVKNHECLALIGRQMAAFLPHPNKRGCSKSCNDTLGNDGLSLLRKHLKNETDDIRSQTPFPKAGRRHFFNCRSTGTP